MCLLSSVDFLEYACMYVWYYSNNHTWLRNKQISNKERCVYQRVCCSRINRYLPFENRRYLSKSRPIYFDGQFCPFSFFHSNTYSHAEISIISLRFGGLEITLVRFSPSFTRFSLCLHFTFLSLTLARVAIFKKLFFASV